MLLHPGWHVSRSPDDPSNTYAVTRLLHVRLGCPTCYSVHSPLKVVQVQDEGGGLRGDLFLSAATLDTSLDAAPGPR